MYVRVRLIKSEISGNPKECIIKSSKRTLISQLKKEIIANFKFKNCKLQLFYNGIQMASDCYLNFYNVKLNDVIQCMASRNCDGSASDDKYTDVFSKFYTDHHEVEIKCESYNAWMPAHIVSIKRQTDEQFVRGMCDEEVERKFHFFTRTDSDLKIHECKFDDLRPKSYYPYRFEELKKGMNVSVYNDFNGVLENKYRFDMEITRIDLSTQIVSGNITYKKNVKVPISIAFSEDFKRIEKPNLLYDPTCDVRPLYMCMRCSNDPLKKCLFCACGVCGLKKDPFCVVQCADCFKKFHYYCIALPIWPRDIVWCCTDCKKKRNIIRFGERPKVNGKKKSAKRNWGGGMSGVGKSKECTLVPVNHFGPIPGIDVGTRWKYRVQLAEAGVHRTHVYGIHGRETDGAYSIVISNGYADNMDMGNEIIYSGSGGKDNYSKKGGGVQNKDQQLTRSNKALALNCNAKFNAEIGAASKKWKHGKPIRVCRSSKLMKFSKYAPKDGIRYDGIYKLVKYYKEPSTSGFIVWKFLLRRDDPSPPPWEKGGREFDIIYPDGYQDFEKTKLENSSKSRKRESSPTPGTSKSENISSKPKKTRGCLPATVTSEANDVTVEDNTSEQSHTETVPKSENEVLKSKDNNSTSKTDGQNELQDTSPDNKRHKHIANKKNIAKKSFTLEKHIEDLIKSDVLNKSLWDECLEFVKMGRYKFTLKVQEQFRCIVCQEVVFDPVTPCPQHNICLKCLKRSFEANLFQCPYCRKHLGYNYNMKKNTILNKILLLLLPGYEQNR